MGNVLHLGDKMMCHLAWGYTAFPVVVRGFDGPSVHVEAETRSDDPGVENEWHVPFSWLASKPGSE